MNAFKGSGKLFFALYDASDVLGPYYEFGNATEISLAAEGETIEVTSTDNDNYGSALDSLVEGKPATGKMTVNRFNRRNMALAFGGSATARSGSSTPITDENVTVVLDAWLKLANEGIGSVTVSRKNGDDAGTWAATTAYALDDYILPSTPAGRFYKCTTAGTSGASEPTWPTTLGGTVTDGAVVWTDMGTIAAALTTDYLLNTDLGLIEPLSTGQLVADEVLNVDYTVAAETGYEIAGGVAASQRIALLLDGRNRFTSEKVYLEIPKATIKASGGFNFMAAEPAEQQFDITCIVPTGATSSFTVRVQQ